MTSSAIIALAAALAVALSTIGPAIGQGITASKAMEAMARQPEAARQYPFQHDYRPGADGGPDHLRPAHCFHADR